MAEKTKEEINKQLDLLNAKYVNRERVESVDVLIEPIWEHQPQIGETLDDYKQFMTYASIEPNGRSYTAAYRIWKGDPNIKRVSPAWSDKGAAYLWVERASQWDIAKLKEHQADWILRDNERREEDYSVADLLRRLARDKLETMSPDILTAHQAARFLELASKLQSDSIPRARLEKDEIRSLMESLPEDRRRNIVAILIAKSNNA